MSEKWLKKLKVEYPTLAESAVRLNRRDGFLMPDERKQIELGSNKDDDSRKDKKRKGGEKKKSDGSKKAKLKLKVQ